MPSDLLRLIDQLEREHAEVRAALGALGVLAEAEDAAGIAAALPGMAAVLAAGLDAHSGAEDETLFPAVADEIGEGVIEAFAAEHAEILALRDELYRGGDGAPATCQGLRALLESHMDREELVLFPSVRELLGERS
jgi:hemerythrin-like domain-containing protein